MDDKELMHITPGVHSPWFVKSVEPDGSEERIDIYLDFIKGSRVTGKKVVGGNEIRPPKD
jgi:hypothetical protein